MLHNLTSRYICNYTCGSYRGYSFSKKFSSFTNVLSLNLTQLTKSTLLKSELAFSNTKRTNVSKTILTVLNREEDAPLMINDFNRAGFILNNKMTAVGPIALFPKSVLSWNVASANDIHEDSLSLFLMLQPKLDILVIGTGSRGLKMDENVIKFVRQRKIGVEVCATEVAIQTYNFIVNEGRIVAAALIPPLDYVDRRIPPTRKNAERGEFF